MNALTWTFIGRGSSLRLAAQFFEATGRSAEGDTLHVVGSHAQYRGGRTPLYFSRAERERFLRDLRAAGGVRTVVYHDSVTNVFSADGLYFSAIIDSEMPLVVNVYSAVSTSGYGAAYNRRYIWAFGWRPIGSGRLGES